MELDTEDLLILLNGAVSFVAGVVGWEFTTVYNLALCVLGVAALYAAKKTGKAVRWTAVKGYRTARWLVTASELSELGNALLKHLRQHTFDFRGYECDLYCGRVRIVSDENCRVKEVIILNGKPGEANLLITKQLTKADLKALSKLTQQMWDRWDTNEKAKIRRTTLEVLANPAREPGVLHFQEPKVVSNQGWVDLTNPTYNPPIITYPNANPNGAEST